MATSQSDQSNSSTEVASSQRTPGCVKMTVKTNQDTYILVSNPQHTDCVTKIDFGGLGLSSIPHRQFNLTSHSLIDWQVRHSWIFLAIWWPPNFSSFGNSCLGVQCPTTCDEQVTFALILRSGGNDEGAVWLEERLWAVEAAISKMTWCAQWVLWHLTASPPNWS